MSTATQNILDLFNQLPEIEKHEFASEIIKWTVKQDFPPLTDEALVQAADALFIELDKSEARDADSNALKEGIVLYERG